MSESPKYSNVLAAITAVALIFGMLGFLDMPKAPYSGYFTGLNADVVRVFPGSPAGVAGLEVGDVIRSIGGISLEDTKAIARRPRPEIGETRTFVVDRSGEALEFDVTYGTQPSRLRVTIVLGSVVALCFLFFGQWAYRRAPNQTTLILALQGLCFGIAFLPAPYSNSFLLRTLGGAFTTVLIVFGLALLVHFLMLFPRRRAFLDKSWALQLIYGPATAVNLFLLFVNLALPDFTGTLRTILSAVTGLMIVGYFGWALVAMIQSYLRASSEERSSYGIALMLLGTLVGLLPVTLSALAIRASILLPGAQYYGLALGLIPITFALAAVRKHRAETAA